MTELSPTLQAEQRAQQHWAADGLPSIIAGIGGLVLAFFILYLKNGHSGFKVLVLLCALTLYWVFTQRNTEIVDWLKTRLSYPRTGYVRPPYKPEDKSLPLDFKMLSMQGTDTAPSEETKRQRAATMRQVWIVLFLIFSTSFGLAYFRPTWIHSPWVYSVLSFSLIAMVWLFARIEHRPVSWIPPAGLALVGFSMSVLQLRGIIAPDQFGYFLAGISLVSILNGVVSLIRFLRRNPHGPLRADRQIP